MNRLTSTIGILLLIGGTVSAQLEPPDNIEWVTSPHFSSRGTTTIDSIVMHTTEGSYNGAIGWFQNSNSNVSSHFIISPTGEITQMVEIEKKAWHATYYNARSIGVDVAGKSADPNTWTPEAMEALTNLVAWLCWTYDINVAHPSGDAYDYPDNTLAFAGIVGHGQVQPWNRSDPGQYFPWESFLIDVQAMIDAATMPEAPTGLKAVVSGTEISFQWDPARLAEGYAVEIATSAADLEGMTGSFQTQFVGNETDYVWSGLSAGQTYYWRVQASNSAGSVYGYAPDPFAAQASEVEDDDDSSCGLLGIEALLLALLLAGIRRKID